MGDFPCGGAGANKPSPNKQHGAGRAGQKQPLQDSGDQSREINSDDYSGKGTKMSAKNRKQAALPPEVALLTFFPRVFKTHAA